MAATAPWSIKGVDPKTRKLVKSHAQKADVTMGEWLSDAVNMAALKDYIAAPDNQSEAPQTNNKFNTEQNADRHQNVDTMKNSSNKAQPSREHNHLSPPKDGYDNQPQHQASQQQASKDFNVIEDALNDIVDHIELVDDNNSQALRDMQSQIARLNATAQSQSTASSQNGSAAYSLHREFGDMEGRLANLADRIDELNESNAALTAQVQGDVKTSNRTGQYEQNVMSSRFDELFTKLDNITNQQSDYGNSVKYLELGMKNQLNQISNNLRPNNLGLNSLGQGHEPQTNDYNNEIIRMEDKLSSLSARLEFSLNEPAVDPQIAELEQQIGGLSQKLTDLLSAPEPEYSPIPTTRTQTAETTTEITELRESIVQINLRLEKTEDRLSGIDRLEDNMGKLITSVADIRANSHDVAQEAATAAIKAFAIDQKTNVQASQNKQKDQANIDAMIANKFAEISQKNNAAEKTQLSGFKTVEKSLEKIMGRLSRVENERHHSHAPTMAPPDPRSNSAHYEQQRPQQEQSEQGFIQPGADTKAQQPQDINAAPSRNPNMAATRPAPAAISAPTRKLTQETAPAASIQTANIEATPHQRRKTDLLTGHQPATAPIGLETPNDARPVAQPSSSTDFIAAARRAAQQSYENEKNHAAQTASGTSETLFSKIKNAAKREQNLNGTAPRVLPRFDESPNDVSHVAPQIPSTDTAETTTKKKFSLPKLGKKKKSADPAMQQNSELYTPDLPTDIFEEDFFNQVDVPADSALRSTTEQNPIAPNVGNELSQQARDESYAETSRKGAAPVLIALILVTAVAGVSWYSLKNVTQPAFIELASTTNQPAAQNKQALTISELAKPSFTPKEFEKLASNTTQTRTPTPVQLEALKNDSILITNSISELSSKSYSTSLLGNGNKFVKTKDNSRIGSSSLIKSNNAVKAVTNLARVKSGNALVVEELPTKIGPKLLRQNAQIGQVAEQFEIANRYALGYGVDIDLTKSYNWFVKAADNKLAVAQFSVGMMLEHGKGTARNLDQARQYYQYAAEQGNLMSIYRLAMMNAAPQNPIIKPDFNVALKWFSMAANAGLVDAQYNLAVMYEKGHGTDVDLVETYKWYSIAGNKGDQQARKRAKIIKLELSTSQVLQAQKAIKAWKVVALPENANSAPKLNYLRNETAANDIKTTKSPHVKSGTLATDLIADKKSIKDTQKMLGKLGWSVGAVDGVMGSKTRKAIREFQTRHNLIINGEVNDELLANLEAATL
ncbi:MAG: SEL1-like repeat protein [Alphaproteobacteria bacterium]|nr:SEL1-like repeat protein [Alphaproteobacteria bacterium]